MKQNNDLFSDFELEGLGSYPEESIQGSECPGTTEWGAWGTEWWSISVWRYQLPKPAMLNQNGNVLELIWFSSYEQYCNIWRAKVAALWKWLFGWEKIQCSAENICLGGCTNEGLVQEVFNAKQDWQSLSSASEGVGSNLCFEWGQCIN